MFYHRVPAVLFEHSRSQSFNTIFWNHSQSALFWSTLGIILVFTSLAPLFFPSFTRTLASTMSSKSSAAGGASLYSPKESTLISAESANPRRQTPSTDHSYRPGQPSGLAVIAGRQEPSQGPNAERLVQVSISMALSRRHHFTDVLLTSHTQEVRNVCSEAQKNLACLNKAVHNQPGIPGKTADLIGNDLLALAHQFVTISSVCSALENKFDEDKLHHRRELIAQQASHEAYQGGLHGQLAKANMTIDEFQNRLRQIEKNSKGELEAKAQRLNEKVNNQKRRINEQQAQIEVCFPQDTQRSKLRACS